MKQKTVKRQIIEIKIQSLLLEKINIIDILICRLKDKQRDREIVEMRDIDRGKTKKLPISVIKTDTLILVLQY